MLLVDSGLHLPMALAILAALYPDDFNLFDDSACEMLFVPSEIARAAESGNFNALWTAYATLL